jgi:hypothetical protein
MTIIAWPLAQRGQLLWSARLLGAGLGFQKIAGVRRDWMDHACEEAISDILRHELDAKHVETLIADGANRDLEQVARDALSDLQPKAGYDDTSHPGPLQPESSVGHS